MCTLFLEQPFTHRDLFCVVTVEGQTRTFNLASNALPARGKEPMTAFVWGHDWALPITDFYGGNEIQITMYTSHAHSPA